MEEKFVFTKDQLDFIEQNQFLIETKDYSAILNKGYKNITEPIVILMWSLDYSPTEVCHPLIIRYVDGDSYGLSSNGFQAFLEIDNNYLLLDNNHRTNHYPPNYTCVEKAKDCITEKLRFFRLPQEVIDKVLEASIFVEIPSVISPQPVLNNYSSNAINSKAINSYWPDPDDTTLIGKSTYNPDKWNPDRIKAEIKKLEQSLIELETLQNKIK